MFIVQFDCAEAVLVEGLTLEEAWELTDDFDCKPKEIIPLEEVEILSAWDKNGWCRVNYRRVPKEDVPL